MKTDKSNTMRTDNIMDKEVVTPEVVKPVNREYEVLEPYVTGTGKSEKTYKRGDKVTYSPEVARQFIHSKKIR